jgi:hypothetical protein
MKLATLMNRAELISLGIARRWPTPTQKQATRSVSQTRHRSIHCTVHFSSLRSVFNTTQEG